MKRAKRFIGLLLVLTLLMSVCSVISIGATETETSKMELTMGNLDVSVPVSWTSVEGASKYVFTVDGNGYSKNVETAETQIEILPAYYCENALVQVKAYDATGLEIGKSPTYVYSFGRACADWAGKYGDVDYDFEVTIKDATLIQKHIAGMERFEISQKWNASVDRDGKITIKDATIIQKYLAEIETESHIGEEYFGGCEVYFVDQEGIYLE